jgi:ribonuclease HI
LTLLGLGHTSTMPPKSIINYVGVWGRSLYISKNHLYKIKMGLGTGTNNHAELMALKLLLQFAGEKEV